jgi:hypothetical protein
MRTPTHLNTLGKISTFIIILLYIVLVALDLYTTYLSTPNLVFEANPVIVCFDLNWQQIILVASFFTVLMSVAFVYA